MSREFLQICHIFVILLEFNIFIKIVYFLSKIEILKKDVAISNRKGGNMMKVIDKIALVLIIIGAINWGLIGLLNFNLVEMIFGQMTIISRIIYALVGISGIWGIKLLFDN